MPYKDPEQRREAERIRRLKKRREKNKNNPMFVPRVPLPEEPEAPKPPDGKRRCAEEECLTVLSIYNNESYCARHLPAVLRKNPNLNRWLMN